ncbi:hypothetical protein L9F63_025845 [Diploptera punctata]|uniref:Uncharacterized protein n=1 Tax=Diploptera punctata TaxID=6984 RepID=A0AAD8E3B1_DIPPU|nr:hypothetical protein L9F63_025845 [Diploptera punctata]
MPSMSKQTSKFQGFSTASGKDVVISDEALNRAKLLFSEEGDNITVVPSTSKQTSKFQGFSTAGGKEVSVSEEALNRAKLLFSEEGENTTAMPSPSASKQTSKFQGFTTAGGREVSVSQEALNRAKLLFSEEVENITAVPSTSKQTSKFQGFSTSSGKEVAISDEALNRAKLLFSEKEEKTTAMASTSKQTSKFQDFSTDSDKEVSVSENALNKAKILFSGTEFDDKIFGNKLKTYKSKLQKFTELNSNMNSLDIALLSQDVINEFSKNELCTSWVSENISDSCDLKITKSKHDAENSNKKNLHINSDEESLDSPKINEINHNFIEDLTSFDETELSLSPVLKSSLTSRKVKHISAKKQIKNRLSLSRKNKLKHSDLNKSCIVKNDINMNKTGEETSMKHSVVEKVAEDNGENYCNRKKRDALVTLTQEVQESAAALLADEDMFDASLWSYISCPDMVYDHPCAPAAVVCSEESVTRADDTGTCSSPVLGGGDRRKKRSKFSQNSNCSSLKQSSPKMKSSSFKVPYKNTTPVAENLTPKCTTKKIGRQLDFSTPFAKRLKISEVKKTEKICKSNYLENKNVAAERQAAADAQDALIKHKLSLGATSRPCKGSYYLSKQQTHLQRTWQEVVEGEAPGNYTRKQKCSVSNTLDGSEDHLYKEDNDDDEEVEESSHNDFQGF